jgi:hypothetical protein
MTVQFHSEEVRRRFLDDVAELIIETDENRDDFTLVGYDRHSLIHFSFPDLPYFDTDMPDVYWNFLDTSRANQVLNHGLANSKYGEHWRGYNRLLALKNMTEEQYQEHRARRNSASICSTPE